MLTRIRHWLEKRRYKPIPPGVYKAYVKEVTVDEDTGYLYITFVPTEYPAHRFCAEIPDTGIGG